MDRLIVIATPAELAIAEEHFRGLTMPPVLVTGIGAMNVIQALKDLPRDMKIYNFGYAGAKGFPIGKKYRIGSVRMLCSIETGSPMFDISYTGETCYTSTDFVRRAHQEKVIYDMELAFICALGFEDIEAYKVISDSCNFEEYLRNV